MVRVLLVVLDLFVAAIAAAATAVAAPMESYHFYMESVAGGSQGGPPCFVYMQERNTVTCNVAQLYTDNGHYQ